MIDEERDEYREELCHDRRERQGEGWRKRVICGKWLGRCG